MSILEARSIRKFYPSTATLANDDLSVHMEAGEIRAVVGENGAGKSTFARILAGIIEPDSGEVRVRGRILEPGSVRRAEAAGIGLVPQHSFLAESLCLAEALALGREPRRLGLFDRSRAYTDAAELISRFGFSLDPEARVSSLSPSERRQAEIVRALSRGGDILILDEPTALLTETETLDLFARLKALASRGKAILFITHRAAEVRALAHYLSVLRGGRLVAELPSLAVTESELSRLMANVDATCRSPAAPPDKPTASPEAGPAVAAVCGDELPRLYPSGTCIRAISLHLGGRRDESDLSFSVESGEVYGLVALAGNGLDALEAVAAGLARPRSGQFLLDGRVPHEPGARSWRRTALGYVPSDREARGLALGASVLENLMAGCDESFTWMERLRKQALEKRARELASLLSLDVDLSRPAWTLSGGNRQRLLLARELGRSRKVYVLAEPSQGLDVAAQEEARVLIRRRREEGSAILLLSSSIEEALLLSDRIGVLYRGRLVFETRNHQGLSAHEIAAHMTGLGAA